MNIKLPAPIAAFFRAHNTGRTDEFNELFTGDALVTDEDFCGEIKVAKGSRLLKNIPARLKNVFP